MVNVARIAALVLVVLGLAGCAGQPAKPAYTGVFTGEFVDGLPLYRLPDIEVVGSRKDLREPEPDGS
jgi:hypothetical protein